MTERSAIVIGGGLGGLSAALYLRRAGLSVSVFEAGDELSEVDTGLSLWAFAVRRLAELGVADALPSIGTPIERVVHRDDQDRLLGDVDVTRLNRRIGYPSYEIHRSKFQRLLADALGQDYIAFGRACASVRDGGDHAQAVFEDGEVVSADVLVGADGVHSVTRQAVCPEARLRRGRVGVWRGTTAGSDLPAGLHLRYMGRARLFGVARMSDDLVRWYAGARHPAEAPSSGREMKELAQESFSGSPDLVRTTLDRTPEADYLFNDTPHSSPYRRWGHSRITLLGDAAHSSMPTLGISAGLAVEDAARLAENLESASDVAVALRAYERERRRATARVVRAAALFGRILMVERQPAYAIRQVGVRLAPQRPAVRWLVGGGRF